MGGNKKPHQTDFSWDTFVFIVFYIGNIPQLLAKIFKAEKMPAIVATEPEKLIIFWKVILFLFFVLIVPGIIAYFFTHKNISIIKNWCWGILPIGRIVYGLFWLLALAIFAFYMATEIAGIQ